MRTAYLLVPTYCLNAVAYGLEIIGIVDIAAAVTDRSGESLILGTSAYIAGRLINTVVDGDLRNRLRANVLEHKQHVSRCTDTESASRRFPQPLA